MQDKDTTRLAILDGLRGLAIAVVVWYHLRLVSGFAVPGLDVIARGGFLGVDLFFFVSGFCIAYPYVRARARGTPLPRLGEFVRRRVQKIVPSYVLALVVFALVYRERFTSSFDEFAQFIAHLAFVHVWFPTTFGSFSGPLWTLGVEVQFYVLFAALAPTIARRPVTVYAAFVGIAVVYRAAIGFAGLDTDFGWLNQLPAVLDVFGAGLVTAWAFVQLQPYAGAAHVRYATALAAGAATLALVGLVGLYLATNAGGDEAAHRWLNAWRPAFGPVFAAGTLGVAFGATRLRTLASARPLVWLSLVSYNAYLWNLEIAVGLANTGLLGPAVFLYGGIATLVVAFVVTYTFERPLQRARFEGAWARLRTLAILAFPARASEPSVNA